MTRAVIGGEKIYIEEQPTDTNKTIYTKMSDNLLIFIIYISAVFRIDKRKYYTLSR